jgi:Fe-S-cluster containining protein
MSNANQPLHHLDTQIESRVQTIRADRDWWPCRRGCDHCCRHLAHPPELSPAEWERVDAAVASLPAPIQEVVEQKIDTLLRQLVEQETSSAVVCPYLDEQEGACRIYEARPIACRTYGFFVTRDQDQYCEQIEAEVNNRRKDTIVWGNAEAIRTNLEQMSGTPIPFEEHYLRST